MSARFDSEMTYDEVISRVKNITTMLETTQKKAETLEKTIDSMQWTGDHSIHVKAILEMTIGFHKDILKYHKELELALEMFKSNYENLEYFPTYQSVKNS
ncbi:MAG: hypothetical protein ACK5LC_08780 [Coprobacillaceae bacterium]